MIKKNNVVFSILIVAFSTLAGCINENESEETGEDLSSYKLESNDSGRMKESSRSDMPSADQDESDIDIFKEDIVDPQSYLVLVNKEYALPEDFEPEDLVTVEVPTVLGNPEIRQLRSEASEALKEMFDAALEEGIHLHARSGYRSYRTQVDLYNRYVSNHGEAAANRYSAQPGHSEHQTGLAMDVTSESVNYQLTELFRDTPEGVWVKENAHAFGYIIRYPEGKEDITGYQFEPWHLRYLGEAAADVYESELTYEEFLLKRGVDIAF